MKRFFYHLCPVIFMLFLILLSLFLVVNDTGFYREQHILNETTYDTGMSTSELERADRLLLDYMKGNVESLDLQVKKYGVSRELFDEREKAHMIDVKNLYVTFERVMYLSGLISVCGFVVLFLKDKRDFAGNLAKGFRVSLIPAVILAACFGGAFAFGFRAFWRLFHKVMFTNDLWLLDPAVSTMINMFPPRFFLAMCTRILKCFVVFYVLSIAVVVLADKLTAHWRKSRR